MTAVVQLAAGKIPAIQLARDWASLPREAFVICRFVLQQSRQILVKKKSVSA